MKNVIKSRHTTKGNVLDDLGLAPEILAVEKLKFDIHLKILAIVEKKGLSSRDLEKILDRPQPRISELLNGKIASMTIDKLVRYLDRLGGDVELKVKFRNVA